MTGILRFIGIMTAAIWLGGSVFFTFVAGQVPFSPEMKALLERLYPTNPNFSAYFAGAVAQLGIAGYFTFQLVCAVIALAHLALEWLYQERRGRRWLLWLLLSLLGLALVNDFALRPKMERLHATKYSREHAPAQREAARVSFKRWHGLTMALNLFMLGGLSAYMLNMSRPPETARFVRPSQFRG